MDKLQQQLEELLAEVILFKTKPTKKLSGDIRRNLGTLKKDITSIRAEYVNMDKAGYKNA